VTGITRIVLVRHGQTLWNLEQRLQGHKDSPLTRVGKNQALEVRRALAGVDFVAAYVSPLPRAVQTVQLIAGDKNIPVYKVDGLKEIRLGPWEGKIREETRLSHPTEYCNFWTMPERFRLQGAETYLALQNRVVRELESIFVSEQGKTVLVVSHWIAIKVALAYYSSLGINQLTTLTDPGNGSFIELIRNGQGAVRVGSRDVGRG